MADIATVSIPVDFEHTDSDVGLIRGKIYIPGLQYLAMSQADINAAIAVQIPLLVQQKKQILVDEAAAAAQAAAEEEALRNAPPTVDDAVTLANQLRAGLVDLGAMINGPLADSPELDPTRLLVQICADALAQADQMVADQQAQP